MLSKWRVNTERIENIMDIIFGKAKQKIKIILHRKVFLILLELQILSVNNIAKLSYLRQVLII